MHTQLLLEPEVRNTASVASVPVWHLSRSKSQLIIATPIIRAIENCTRFRLHSSSNWYRLFLTYDNIVQVEDKY
jgi:hypothetical protein